MKINMKSLAAGPGGNYGPGLCEVPDDLAKAFLEAGVAELVGLPVTVAPASVEPVIETTELPMEDVEHTVVVVKRGSKKK